MKKMTKATGVDWGILCTVLVMAAAAWVWAGPIEDSQEKWDKAAPERVRGPLGVLDLGNSSALVPGSDKLAGREKWHVKKSGLKPEDYEKEMPVERLVPPIKID